MIRYLRSFFCCTFLYFGFHGSLLSQENPDIDLGVVRLTDLPGKIYAPFSGALAGNEVLSSVNVDGDVIWHRSTRDDIIPQAITQTNVNSNDGVNLDEPFVFDDRRMYYLAQDSDVARKMYWYELGAAPEVNEMRYYVSGNSLNAFSSVRAFDVSGDVLFLFGTETSHEQPFLADLTQDESHFRRLYLGGDTPLYYPSAFAVSDDQQAYFAAYRSDDRTELGVFTFNLRQQDIDPQTGAISVSQISELGGFTDEVLSFGDAGITAAEIFQGQYHFAVYAGGASSLWKVGSSRISKIVGIIAGAFITVDSMEISGDRIFMRYNRLNRIVSFDGVVGDLQTYEGIANARSIYPGNGVMYVSAGQTSTSQNHLYSIDDSGQVDHLLETNRHIDELTMHSDGYVYFVSAWNFYRHDGVGDVELVTGPFNPSVTAIFGSYDGGLLVQWINESQERDVAQLTGLSGGENLIVNVSLPKDQNGVLQSQLELTWLGNEDGMLCADADGVCAIQIPKNVEVTPTAIAEDPDVRWQMIIDGIPVEGLAPFAASESAEIVAEFVGVSETERLVVWRSIDSYGTPYANLRIDVEETGDVYYCDSTIRHACSYDIPRGATVTPTPYDQTSTISWTTKVGGDLVGGLQSVTMDEKVRIEGKVGHFFDVHFPNHDDSRPDIRVRAIIEGVEKECTTRRSRCRFSVPVADPEVYIAEIEGDASYSVPGVRDGLELPLTLVISEDTKLYASNGRLAVIVPGFFGSMSMELLNDKPWLLHSAASIPTVTREDFGVGDLWHPIEYY